MTHPQVPGVRAASIRVALGATLVVAAVYVVIAAAVVVIATRNLTAQIDDQLASALIHVGNEPARPPNQGLEPPPGREGPFERPLIAWTVYGDGIVTSSDPDAILPAEYWTVRGPVTGTIDEASVRLLGAPTGDGRYIVVGLSTGSVSDAQATIILAELIIGPILLLCVFFGAVAIGRRVAAPIERARQRQLEFTADASHELRTPVSVIEAQTSLALSQDRSAEWYRTAFGRVDHETQRMRKLLDDLLWLARFDAAAGQPGAEPVDVGVLAARTVDRFAIVAEARHLTLSLHAASESLVVTVPPEWLDRLLGVLLDNACKYSKEGGAVAVSVAADGGRVRLTVDDGGPGIPEAERSRVFDRFHRATESGAGAGLGLAIADAIVRATNGRWRIGTSSAGGASMSVSWVRALVGQRESQPDAGSGGSQPAAPRPASAKTQPAE